MSRPLSGRRRIAAACGGSAAAISSSVVLLHGHHNGPAVEAVWGFVLGLGITLCIGSFIRYRRGCA